jgi:hypothetical protein
VTTVESAEVDGLSGLLGERVEHRSGQTGDVVALQVGGAGEQRLEAEAVAGAGRVEVDPPAALHGPQDGVQTALRHGHRRGHLRQ